MKDKSIQEEIKTGLKNIKLHKWRYDGGETCFFLNDNDVQLILKYLDSRGVVVATWHEGDLYDDFQRLIEE